MKLTGHSELQLEVTRPVQMHPLVAGGQQYAAEKLVSSPTMVDVITRHLGLCCSPRNEESLGVWPLKSLLRSGKASGGHEARLNYDPVLNNPGNEALLPGAFGREHLWRQTP